MRRYTLAQLLDVSGAVVATAWSAGAALASSYLITGAAAAEDPAKCTCVALPPPPPQPQSPPPQPQPPPPPPLAEARTALTFSGMVDANIVSTFTRNRFRSLCFLQCLLQQQCWHRPLRRTRRKHGDSSYTLTCLSLSLSLASAIGHRSSRHWP